MINLKLNYWNSKLLILLTINCFLKLEAQNPNVSSGKIVSYNNFQSKYVDARNVNVWLPAEYDSTKNYPVLYMHDGQQLFDSTITWNKQEWKMDETASKLIAANKITPFIVVGIWNNGIKRRFEYMPQKPFNKLPKKTQFNIRNQFMNQSTNEPFDLQADRYLKFIVKELKPFIDLNFSTSTNQENTFIGGSSFGGMISWYAVCEYPSIFGNAICMSTHWPGLFPGTFNPQLPEQFLNYLKKKLPTSNSHRIYFDYGTETLDAYYETYQLRVDAVMEQKGYKDGEWMSLKFVGEDHSEKAWAKRLDYPLVFLFGKK